jgi:hypothetical protein
VTREQSGLSVETVDDAMEEFQNEVSFSTFFTLLVNCFIYFPISSQMDEIKSLNDSIEQLQSTQFSVEDEKALEEELESLMKESSQQQPQQPSPQMREIPLPKVPTQRIVQSKNEVACDNERKAVLS